jgi:hypothetical protein
MPDDAPQPDTNKGVIFVVVTTLAFNATLGLTALAYCLIFKVAPDQVLLTAFISIITGLLGVIGGMLTKTSPTQATGQIPFPIPSQVHVTNRPDDPVPTTEAKTGV